MAHFNTVIFVTAIGLLAGCSSPKPKPELPDQRYIQFAGYWVGVQKCGRSGLMAPEIASLAAQYAQADLFNYTFDQARMSKEVERLNKEGREVTAAECNSAAMTTHTRKRQIDQHNAGVEASQKEWADLIKSTQPQKPVYCNKAGTIVACS